MTTAEFIQSLGQRQIRLQAENGQLRFFVKPGVLTAELRAEIVARKAELLAFLQAAQADGKSAHLFSMATIVTRRTADERLSLASGQERLWFLDQLEGASATYNVQEAWWLSGALDAGKLEEAINAFVQRHEALRTNFVRSADGPGAVQVVHERVEVKLAQTDLSGSGGGKEAAVRLADEVIEQTFDLARGPLLRAHLIKVTAEEHLLVLVVHHIVFDGKSANIMRRDLGELYAAGLAGREAQLPALAVHYPDYAVWEAKYLAGESLERSLAFWRQYLAGASGVLEIPADYPRPPVPSYRGAQVQAVMAPALVQRLGQLGRAERGTVFHVAMAAWKILLRRYSGQSILVVGTAVSNRKRTELEPVVGFFVNTLPLRTRLDGDLTVREAVRRVQASTVEAMTHDDLPFERLVQALNPPRSMGVSPVFQVCLSYVKAAGEEAFGPLRLRPEPLHPATAKFDLTLWLTETADGLEVALEYATDLFSRERAGRMLAHYGRLLEAMVDQPEALIMQLPMLTEPEHRQVLLEWNATGREYAREARVHELFEAQARARPAATAVHFGTQTLSYAELNARADALAAVLVGLGVGPDVLVGLCVERSFDLLTGVLGILKSGGAYVPIDPTYPADRIAHVLSDSRAPVLVTQRRLLATLPATGAQILCLDEPLPAPGRPAQEPAAPGAENLAYVLYTSGSTGLPKGVMIPHRAVVNFLHAMRREPGLTADDVLLAVTTLSFDIAGLELHLPLTTGATIVLAPWEVAADGAALLQAIARHKVTLLQATPATWRLMLAAGWQGTPGLKALCGGEALPADLAAELLPRCAELWNMYGPTETTIWSTCSRVTRASDIHIGRPIDNTEIYILDAQQQPLPAGLAGELLIGGEGLARGYLNRAELTAEKFIPHPFKAGERLYRTGDLARYRTDGNIDCLGRLDFQVKIRGFRIELGEIETQLAAHPEVQQNVVVAREDPSGDKRLVAYVVARPGTEPTAASLRDHLRGKLPDYMMPAVFVPLAVLPLTPNGKIDRKALPAPGAVATAPKQALAPRNPTEVRLATIFTEVLGQPVASVTDNFFELGGHSLLAVKLMGAIDREFGIRLPLARLFDASSIEQLGQNIDQQQASEVFIIAPVTPRAADEVLPLASAQERLWFLDQLEGASATYNVHEAWRLSGALDAGKLEEAINAFVQRHEALRTNFVRSADGHGAVQVVHERVGVRLAQTDLSGPDGGEEAAVLLADEIIGQTFDLAGGPLLRAHLIKVATEEHLLVLVVHHVVFDAGSADIMRRDLGELYAAGLAGREAQLPALAVHYPDYAVWEAKYLAGESLERSLAFWRQYLAGASGVLEIPADYPRPPVPSYRGAQVQAVMAPALVQRLGQLGRAERGTVFHVAMAAWKILLRRYSGQSILVVGTAVSNRKRTELEPVVGFFVNTLPLRTRLDGDLTVREAVRRVQASTVEAMTHDDLPFERLVQALNPPRSMGVSPVFQVCLSYVKAAGEEAFGPLRLRPEPLHPATAKFDLTLWLTETADGLEVALEYATDLFSRERAGRMLAHYGRLLEAMVDQPEALIMQLPMLTEPEHRQVLLEWNATGREYAREARVHELFEAQARARPAATAVHFGTQTLSYAELNARADALAAVLVGLGVGPDVLVGLCVERSFDLLTGVLGILKSGGAYVPIDPTYPADRIAHVLSDSRAPVLVTQRRLLATLPATGAQILCLDEPLPAPGRPATEPAAPSAENLAYVLYTSGSTGLPKGVMIPHRAVVNFLHAMRREPGLTADDVLLAVTTLSFDIAGLELHLPLTTGATIVLAPWEVAADGAALLQAIARHKVTLLQATPATWRLMLAAGWQGTPGLKALCGGEALPADLAAELLPRCAELWNMYGPTETTIWSTCSRVTRASDIHIGRPIDNTEIYILDAQQQPLPAGLAGELLIGGEGLARGYLNRAELTAEKFIPHPFKAGERLYRTGDLARYRTDGNIDCLGRLDFQVKIRGFRIELGEIETQLAAHPEVQQNVVVAREDPSGDKRLVAYVVARPGTEPTAASLRDHLRGKLPDYMMPAVFVPLAVLPLTPNGKIDRKALPAPGAVATAPKQALAPRNPTEVRLAAIFTEVLGQPVASVTDNFFELGGHSLLAVKLMGAIDREFGIRLPLARLFDAPTVEQLAVALADQANAPAAWNSLVPIRRGANGPSLFLVHGAGGNILLYRELARELPPEISIFGFQSQGLDGQSAVLSSVDQMARHYAGELLRFQPTGPYYLGGYCMGGIVAYEMARILRSKGHEVGPVAMLDSYNLNAIKKAETKITSFGVVRQKLAFHLESLGRMSPKDVWKYVREKARMLFEMVQQKLANRRKHQPGQAVRAQTGESSLLTIQDINHQAGWDHVPGVFDGHLVLFKPRKNYDFYPDPDMGWGTQVTGRVERVELPANPHAMLINPQVRILATEITDHVLNGRAPGSGPAERG